MKNKLEITVYNCTLPDGKNGYFHQLTVNGEGAAELCMDEDENVLSRLDDFDKLELGSYQSIEMNNMIEVAEYFNELRK